LIIQVVQALARDERTCPFILPVSAFHGWIEIGGVVPTLEIQHVAEKVTGEVSRVRGVIALPMVSGESPNVLRDVVQPQMGAAVYGKNGEVGVITAVVIHPEDRLVTHVVVRSNEFRDIHLIAREHVIPVKDIDLVNDESILLQRNARSLNAYPVLDSDEYPLALFTWKAPYPYHTDEVRWSLPQLYDAPYPPPATSLEPARSELLAVGTKMDPVMERV
jgi:sporulation protein YlmC with PRC-barrel domain